MNAIAIVPYPSTELMNGYDIVSELVELNKRVSVVNASLSSEPVRHVVIPCGSDRCIQEVEKAIEEYNKSFSEPLGIQIKFMKASEKCPNGTPTLGRLLCDGIGKLKIDNNMVLYCPPWWQPMEDVDLYKYHDAINDMNVLSVMLAGWPWENAGGKMNFAEDRCPIEGYSKVRSYHRCDSFIFNVDAPQLINPAVYEAVFPKYDYENAMNHVKSNYWGRDDRNMVLVPKGIKNMFVDTIGTDPIYRPQ